MALTLVIDTRFPITIKFPHSAEMERKALSLLRRSLVEGLYVPSIVITEYINLIGRSHGLESALTHINDLVYRGAKSVSLDKSIAEAAGKMLLQKRVPIADALIAAVCIRTNSTHVISDDPHFSELDVPTRWL